MFILKSQPGNLTNRKIEKTIINLMPRTPEYLNSDTEKLNETRFHSMINSEDDLFRILVDIAATYSYVAKN